MKIQLPKRFEEKDIQLWQKKADKETRGNLTLWMEIALNKAAKKKKQTGSNGV